MQFEQGPLFPAEATGDENPLHLDERYALTTPFRGRIAHGLLTAGMISAVLASRLLGKAPLRRQR